MFETRGFSRTTGGLIRPVFCHLHQTLRSNPDLLSSLPSYARYLVRSRLEVAVSSKPATGQRIACSPRSTWLSDASVSVTLTRRFGPIRTVPPPLPPAPSTAAARGSSILPSPLEGMSRGALLEVRSAAMPLPLEGASRGAEDLGGGPTSSGSPKPAGAAGLWPMGGPYTSQCVLAVSDGQYPPPGCAFALDARSPPLHPKLVLRPSPGARSS